MSDSSVTGGGEPGNLILLCLIKILKLIFMFYILEGSLLIVRPSNVLTFVRDGNDLTSTLELQSKASINISYKVSNFYLILI